MIPPRIKKHVEVDNKKGLVRYELLDMFVRMAKRKYIDTLLMDDLAEAL